MERRAGLAATRVECFSPLPSWWLWADSRAVPSAVRSCLMGVRLSACWAGAHELSSGRLWKQCMLKSHGGAANPLGAHGPSATTESVTALVPPEMTGITRTSVLVPVESIADQEGSVELGL